MRQDKPTEDSPTALPSYRPELFKDLPDHILAAHKLFAVETQRIANKALRVCSSCKKKCAVTMGIPSDGNSYCFHVLCKVCKKSTPDFPVLKEFQGSKLSMMEALASTVESWNYLNERG